MKLARAAATLLALTVLTACADDPDPKVKPSEPPTSATGSTDSPSPRALEEALITDFVDAVSKALATGDPATFLSMTDERCANCQTLAGNLREAYQDSGRIVGGDWQVVESAYVGQSNLGSIWNVDVRTSREVWLDANGETVKTVAADLARFGFAIQGEDNERIVRNLRLRS